MNMIEVKLFTRSLSRNLGLANRELSCYTNKHLTTSASTVNVNYFIWAEYYWWILDSPWEDIRSQIFVHHKHKETSLPVWPAIYFRLSTWRAKGAYSDTCRILQTRTLPPPGGGGGSDWILDILGKLQYYKYCKYIYCNICTVDWNINSSTVDCMFLS